MFSSYIFASYFGRTFLGSIRGIVLPVMLISSGIGAPLVGYIRDNTGSYVSSWWLIFGIYLLAGLIITAAKRPAPSSQRGTRRRKTPRFNTGASGDTMSAARVATKG